MPDRYTRVVVLCEDLDHFNFTRRYLIERGVGSHQIRGRVSPKGRGAGDQYVRENYPREVREIRRKGTYQNVGLVTVIDADTRPRGRREAELATTLTDAGEPAREAGEAIALLVPRRNIESWICHLRGDPVTEEDDCKRRTCATDVTPAAAEFARRCPRQLTDETLPSLRDACQELIRFLGAQSR
jgi:hypothetical protein